MKSEERSRVEIGIDDVCWQVCWHANSNFLTAPSTTKFVPEATT